LIIGNVFRINTTEKHSDFKKVNQTDSFGTKKVANLQRLVVDAAKLIHFILNTNIYAGT